MTGRDMICQLLKTKYKYSNIPHTLDHVLEIIAENMNVLDVWKEEQHLVELRDEIKQLERKLKVIKSSSKRSWISVKDRLPELYMDVLVFAKGGIIDVDCLEHIMSWGEEGFCKYGYNVTHWMPLPEAPEREDNANGKDT